MCECGAPSFIPGEIEDCYDCLGKKADADPIMDEPFFYLRRCAKCGGVYGKADATIRGMGEEVLFHLLEKCVTNKSGDR